MSFIFTLMLLFSGGDNIRLEMDFAFPTLVECEIKRDQTYEAFVNDEITGEYADKIIDWSVSECILNTIPSPGNE